MLLKTMKGVVTVVRNVVNKADQQVLMLLHKCHPGTRRCWRRTTHLSPLFSVQLYSLPACRTLMRLCWSDGSECVSVAIESCKDKVSSPLVICQLFPRGKGPSAPFAV